MADGPLVMDVADHVRALHTQGELLAAAAARAGADAPVPSCPEWHVRDLVHHMGMVHRWAKTIVAEAHTSPVDGSDTAGELPDDGELVGWFREGHRDLVDALTAAPDDLECWAFLPAPSPLAFWARRQAHETAIHRVDAELAAGDMPTPTDTPLAADGLDELLMGFVPRPRTKLRADPAKTLAIRPIDSPPVWILRIGPDAVTGERDPADPTADCDVRGSAHDLFLALWNRRATADLDVTGDATLLDHFCDSVHVRWS